MSTLEKQQSRYGILVLFVLFLISLLQLHLAFRVSSTLVRGDGIGYYAYLRSAFFDLDLDFSNEYEHFLPLFPPAERPMTNGFLDQRTATGHLPNNWPVGPALLWSPWFLSAHGAVLIANGVGIPVAADGYSLPYQLSVALASATYGFLGLVLVYVLCQRWFNPWVSMASVLATWFATSLTAYMYFMVSMSHACSFFCVALFLWEWQRGQGNLTLTRSVRLGLLAGLMALQRYQDVVIAAVLIPELLPRLGVALRKKQGPELIAFVRFSLGFLLATLLTFSPQLLVWKILYGQFLVQPYALNRGEVMNWLSPELWGPLLSLDRGLIPWTPAAGLGLIGLYWLARRDRQFTISVGLAFLAELYVVGSFPNWRGGASFGARYLLSTLPILAIGLAALNDRIGALRRGPASSIAVTAALILWNYLLLFQYGTGMIPRAGHLPWDQIVQNVFIRIPKLILEHFCK